LHKGCAGGAPFRASVKTDPQIEFRGKKFIARELSGSGWPTPDAHSCNKPGRKLPHLDAHAAVMGNPRSKAEQVQCANSEMVPKRAVQHLSHINGLSSLTRQTNTTVSLGISRFVPSLYGANAPMTVMLARVHRH